MTSPGIFYHLWMKQLPKTPEEGGFLGCVGFMGQGFGGGGPLRAELSSKRDPLLSHE